MILQIFYITTENVFFFLIEGCMQFSRISVYWQMFKMNVKDCCDDIENIPQFQRLKILWLKKKMW